ncbi:MAG TPA: polysaccharide deacetylase family protein [Chloroflexia bacterium]
MINGLSIDVEDWFQGFNEIAPPTWHLYEHRLAASLERTLQLLDDHSLKATFFVLGHNAEHYPHLVRRIHAAGHELGTHGYSHTLVYNQAPCQFREELRRSICVVEDACGEKVLGHRAAFFSITPRSKWALDVLIELGLQYDSSIFPVRRRRYGWPGGPHRFCRIVRPGGSLIEFPLPTWNFGLLRLPVGGGAYQRILPERYIFAGLRRLNRAGQPFVAYLHPWELDPEQPRGITSGRAAWLHYANLSGSTRRFARLLARFNFAPLRDLTAQMGPTLPDVVIK